MSLLQNDGSCAEVARAIQDACTVRYQLLLAKQEELKRLEKPEPQGVSDVRLRALNWQGKCGYHGYHGYHSYHGNHGYHGNQNHTG